MNIAKKLQAPVIVAIVGIHHKVKTAEGWCIKVNFLKRMIPSTCLFPFCVAMSEHVSDELLPDVARHIEHVESMQVILLVIGCCPSLARRSASPPLNCMWALICLHGPLQVT